MIVDSSAIVSIATREHGFEKLTMAIVAATARMSAISLFESRIVLTSTRFGISAETLTGLLNHLGIETVDFTAAHGDIAARAYERFGKGRHPARLNLGDCASYATAQLAGEPLLFVGDDFAKTDIPSALM